MSASAWTAISAAFAAFLAMGGTVYTARQSRQPADRAQDLATFQALTGGLQSDLTRVKEDLSETRAELRETRAQLRDAVGYIRVVVDEMRRHNITPPPIPPSVASFPWEP